MTPALLTDSVTLDLKRSVHYALLWGHQGVVLRTVGNARDRVPFVNEHQLLARLAKSDLPIDAVMPGIYESRMDERTAWLNDHELLAEVAAFCSRVSCPLIISGALAGLGTEFDIDASAEVLSQAGQIAHNHGIGLAVRNEAFTNCSSGEKLARLVSTVSHQAVSAAWSPADALQSGCNPTDGLGALVEQCSVAIVFVRDGRSEASAWVNCVPGEGDVGWANQALTLRKAGFDGSMCLDVHGDQPARQGLEQSGALVDIIRSAP